MSVLISHFYNESLLLPFWIVHHRNIFDHGVIINYGSTDESVAIIKALVPDWEVRPSRNTMFDASLCDQEVMQIEREFTDWKVVLNTTEFLLHHDLAGYLGQLDENTAGVWTRSVMIVDSPEMRGTPLNDDYLVLQRRWGLFDEPVLKERSRLLHRAPDGQYSVGRHSSTLPGTVREPCLYLLWFCWSPYDQIKPRKLQIQHRIPSTDRERGWGWQHFVTDEELERRYAEISVRSRPLEEDPDFRLALQEFENAVRSARG